MIEPHGNELVNLFVNEKEKKNLEQKAITLKKIILEDRYTFDCEMLANGGFTPLKGFMKKKEVLSVLNNMQLLNKLIWSIPVILPNTNNENFTIFEDIALYDKYNRLIAILNVEELFELDLENYCKIIFGTNNQNHPGVKFTKKAGNKFIAGEIILINRPLRDNIKEKYYLDPKKTREIFEQKGWKKIVAFQTRNPIHRAHEYLIKCALESSDGFLIHPIVGSTKSDDIPASIRMKCYEVLIENYFNKQKTMLAVLPAAMRYAGPREAIFHMIIRKNYGCSHMIVGRDHAGVGDYYGTYEAQELVDKFREELGVKAIKFEHSFFCKICENIASTKTCPHSSKDHFHLSGTKVREMLRKGERPPKEFSRPEIADILIDWVTKYK